MRIFSPSYHSSFAMRFQYIICRIIFFRFQAKNLKKESRGHDSQKRYAAAIDEKKLFLYTICHDYITALTVSGQDTKQGGFFSI